MKSGPTPCCTARSPIRARRLLWRALSSALAVAAPACAIFGDYDFDDYQQGNADASSGATGGSAGRGGTQGGGSGGGRGGVGATLGTGGELGSSGAAGSSGTGGGGTSGAGSGGATGGTTGAATGGTTGAGTGGTTGAGTGGTTGAGTGGMVGTGGVAGTGGTAGTGGSGGAAGCTPVAGGSLFAEWPMPNPPGLGLPNPQSYTTAGLNSVLDRVTCLEWQRATNSSTYTQAAAIGYCDQLSLDGHDDWRLPTRIELATLVDFTKTAPTIDTVAFPGTIATRYWTRSTLGRTLRTGWWVTFGDGSTSWEDDTVGWRARCVRSVGNAPVVQRYIVGTGGAGGTVYDVATKLTWQQNANTMLHTWSTAQAYCASLSLNGPGWRVPSLNELQTLIDETRNVPAINSTIFPSTDIRGYWTSSKLASDPNTYAWRVDFYDGVTGGGAPVSTWTDPVRCVR